MDLSSRRLSVRELSWDDISHYHKFAKILTETDRIMREIELPFD